MREIKFKAKRVSDGEWVESTSIQNNPFGRTYLMDTKRLVECYNKEVMPSNIWIEIDPNTICQFTGLPMIEVFYNDMLELTYKGKTKRLQVSFSEVNQCLVFLYLDEPKVLGKYVCDKYNKSWWEYNCKNGSIKVIGNIHNK